MSETIRGHHTATQTLTAATPSVTITGAITAYGAAGLYLRNGVTAAINAALFAPATASFNILNQGYIGATIPGSPHPVIDYGIALGAAATLTNTGTIAGPAGIGAFNTTPTTILNAGLITTSYYAGITAFNAPATLTNTGAITAAGIGIQLHQGGLVQNTGSISGGITSQDSTTILNFAAISGLDGIALLSGANSVDNAGFIQGNLAGIAAYFSPLTLVNTGTITSQYGLLLDAGGQITDSGLIQGSGVAIKDTGPLSLILTPGARLIGAVDDTSGDGALTLAGTNAGALNIGIDFFGMPSITFAQGATWTLEGSMPDLAAGQTLTGFTQTDTLILDGFSATSETFGATGLTLANATSTTTLALNAPPQGSSLAIQAYSGNTTLAAAFNNPTLPGSTFIPGIIISTATTTGLIPVSGESITLTPAGTITTNGPAIYLGNGVSNVYISNAGALLTPGTPLPAIYGNGTGITINNTGSIGSEQAVYLRHNGTLFNSGDISGAVTNFGVRLINGSLNNSGTIAALSEGVVAFTTCDVTNTGTISGGEFGVIIDASTLNNTGTLASTFTAVDILTYGSLINGGAITGTGYGIQGLGLGFITNTGNIWGGLDGVALNFSSSSFSTGGFTNTSLASTLANTGSIGGGDYGLKLGSGLVDVINAGTISGGTSAIQAKNAFTLTAEPGAVFNGAVTDQAGTGALILAGNLDIAPNFSGFSTLSFPTGSSGTLEATPTQLAAGQTITGFAQGDTLILDGFAAATSTYAPGTGLILSNPTGSETLGLTGISQFTIMDNANGDTVITEVACFLRGTRIATPRGQIPVEKLTIGELVNTMHGPQPIRWIGHRAYANQFIRNNPNALPIRIRRHAIAPNIPSRDLYVSPDHAIAEGGVLIHAHLLQNGISFHQPDTNEDIEYFHLEFDTHTVIFAENLSTESFIDEGAGNRFHNAHTRPRSTKPQKPCLPRVFGGFHLQNIKSRIAKRAGIKEPTSLGPLRGVLDDCTPTLIRGWAQNSAAPEHPVTLEIISGAYTRTIIANTHRPDLRAAGLGSGCHGFSLTLPNLQHPITLRRTPDGATLPPPDSRHCEPASRECVHSRDAGVAIQRF